MSSKQCLYFGSNTVMTTRRPRPAVHAASAFVLEPLRADSHRGTGAGAGASGRRDAAPRPREPRSSVWRERPRVVERSWRVGPFRDYRGYLAHDVGHASVPRREQKRERARRALAPVAARDVRTHQNAQVTCASHQDLSVCCLGYLSELAAQATRGCRALRCAILAASSTIAVLPPSWPP